MEKIKSYFVDLYNNRPYFVLSCVRFFFMFLF